MATVRCSWAPGTVPESARPWITTPSASRRSSNSRAASRAGSSDGTLSDEAGFTGSQLTNPSSTERALNGPDWIDQSGLKRSGHVPR